MIDDFSPIQSWERFLAQRDGTPFEPLTEEALGKLQRCQTPNHGADTLGICRGNLIHNGGKQ